MVNNECQDTSQKTHARPFLNRLFLRDNNEPPKAKSACVEVSQQERAGSVQLQLNE
jgi:hypothetical protein